MRMPCPFSTRPVPLAIVSSLSLACLITSTPDALGQGFNLAPPNTAGRSNANSFSRSNGMMNAFRPPMQRNFGTPNTGGINNNPGFNSNGANIASGVLGIIGGALNAANQASQNSMNSRPQARAPMLVPNGSGRNNFNGFTSNQMFRPPTSGNSTSGNSWSSSSQPYYRTSPSSSYSTSSSNGYSGSGYRTNSYRSGVSQPAYSSGPSYSSGTRTVQYSDGSRVVYADSPSSSPSISRGNVATVDSTPAYVRKQPPSLDTLMDSMPVVLRCPSEEIGIFSYQLISRQTGKTYDYTMTPGQRQEFQGGSKWKIRFDQGSGKGTLTYDLSGGQTYQARKNGDGLWGVYGE